MSHLLIQVAHASLQCDGIQPHDVVTGVSCTFELCDNLAPPLLVCRIGGQFIFQPGIIRHQGAKVGHLPRHRLHDIASIYKIAVSQVFSGLWVCLIETEYAVPILVSHLVGIGTTGSLGHGGPWGYKHSHNQN